jgi:hypothetical protein
MDKSYVSIGELERLYEFRDEAAVKDFLKHNPDVLPVLAEAPNVIHQAEFFPNAQLFLEVEESEYVEGKYQLLLYIATNNNPAAAFEKLQSFDQTWWIDNLDRTKNKLSIHLEYL